MREFNLSHAVSAYSTYASAMNSLWGLYIVATFSAAGFGATMGRRFTTDIALILTIAYLAFAAGHLRALMVTLNRQKIIAAEVIEQLQAGGETLTPYPRSIAAITAKALSPTAIWVIHLTIDACIVGVMWRSAI